MQPVKIIILGIQSPTAQAILEQLAIHGYPSEQVFLLNQQTKTLKKQFYKGEEKRITSLKVFDWKPPCIILLCDKKMIRFVPKENSANTIGWLIARAIYPKHPVLFLRLMKAKLPVLKNIFYALLLLWVLS